MRPRRGIAALVVALSMLAGHAAAAVEIEARVGRRTVTLGETTTLEVIVRGAASGVHDPDLNAPNGIEVLGSGRSSNFSMINGKSSLETVFRYELAPSHAGNLSIGPIRVRVGNQTFQSPAITLRVSAASARLGSGGGHGPASLIADVVPRDPYVGQPVLLRVRLVQRAKLAEDPRYAPPTTTGFWSERWSDPESYYADEAQNRVLVTETRTRLIPLATGTHTIGEAVATLALAVSSSVQDPLQWFRGRPPRREVEVKSGAVRVPVRPLPSGAPEGFDGAVGRFRVAWSADRARTSQDVPLMVRLEVRGPGNLPLLHEPRLGSQDFEVFPGTIEDSVGAPGMIGAGRRRFQWTVLARRTGNLQLEMPPFVWFDPELGSYQSAVNPPIEIEVGPPLAPGGGPDDVFPVAFATHPLDPFGHSSQPWAWALAGLVLAGAWRVWRGAKRPDPHGAERAQAREAVHAVGRGTGPDFWRAADQACGWLEREGRPVPELRSRIEAARYGGQAPAESSVRPELLRRLQEAMPAPPARRSRWLAIPLTIAAVVLGVLFGPQPGDPQGQARARTGDEAARRGDLDRARREWVALWREDARPPGLAARLGWLDARSGRIGPAALWVLRGDLGEPRDAALDWTIGQVREAGGLTGYRPQRFPLRRLEWSLLALVLGAVAVAAWPRRAIAIPAAALMMVAVAAWPAQTWMAQQRTLGVVNASVPIDGTDLELEAGQVVVVRERAGERATVGVGPHVTGGLPLASLLVLERDS